MNRIYSIVLAVWLLFPIVARAQTPQYSFTSTTSTNNSFPFNTSSSNKVQWLFKPTDFSGSPPSGVISKIYFKSGTNATNTTYTNLMIQIGNTALNAFSSGPWQTGLTTVFAAPTHVIPSVTNGGWVVFTLQTPVLFDNTQNMIVEVSQTAYSNGFTVPQASLANRRLYANVTAASGTAGSGLTHFGFDIGSLGANNAGTVSITEPLNFCAGTYPVKLKIRNNGTNTINNVQVHWLLDGVAQTPISYTTALAPLGSPSGNEAIITLGNVAFANAARTIKAWTTMPNSVTDTVNYDDTLSVTMHAALSGIYTIGGASPDYPSINAAAADLNDYGVCGPVTFNIRNGTYTGQQAALNNISGASAVNRITFRSETGNAANVTLSNASTSTANYIFKLSNASWITIADLTINPTFATYCRGIEIAGSSGNDSILRCRITMPMTITTSSNAAGIYASDMTGNNNVVKNVTTEKGGQGIYWDGNSTTLVDGHVIDSNTIQDASYYGIYLSYNQNLKLRGNSVINAASTTGSTFYAISCNYSDTALVASDNVINVTGTSTVYGLRIYYCDGSDNNLAKRPLITRNKVNITTSGTVYGLYHYYTNNTHVVNNIVDVTTSGTTYGLYEYNSSDAHVYNNTIRSNSTGTTNYAAYLYHTATYTGTKIRNNIFRNAGTTGYAVYGNGFAYMSSDFNNITGGTAGLFYDAAGGNPVATLSDWRILSGLERNSISFNPGFISAANMQPDPANDSAWSLNGRGEQAAWNNTDFNGNPRSTTLAGGVPDIGAYEFLPTVLPPLAEATPAAPVAGSPQVFTFGSDTVAVINWAVASAVPASVNVRQYSGTVPPTFPPGEYMYFYTDMSAAGGPFSYSAQVYYKDPWLGTSSLETALRMAKKDGAAAWVFYPTGTSSVNTTWNRINANGLTALSSLFSGRTEQCSGTPLPAVFFTPPFAAPKCVGDSVTIDADDPNGTIGITYQWEQSATATGPWSNAAAGSGATSLSYTTPALNDSMYYRLKVTCGANSSYSAPFLVPVILPQILSTAPAARCGVGTLTVGVTATPGTLVSWHPTMTSTTPIDTGNTYTTPWLTSSATYYAEATTGTIAYVGKPNSTGADGSNTGLNVGLVFDAFAQFNLESVGVYPIGSGAGTITVSLTDASNNVLQSATFNISGSSAPGVYTTLPLNFTVPPGTDHRLLWTAKTGGVSSLIRDYTAGSGISFPYTLPGIVSITGGTTSTYYYYFYNWKIKDGCVSTRVPVTATVTPAPPVTFSPAAPEICLGETTTITASSPNTGYTYTWEPGTLVANSVSLSPTVTTDYYITALDNSGGANDGCVLYDTITLKVNPLPAANITVNGASNVCEGDTVELQANTGAAYTYQWLNNNAPIAGATDSLLVITQSGSYAVVVTNTNNCVATSAAEQVIVNPLPNPVITDNNGVLSTGSFAAYQWLRNGQILPGATGQTYIPVVDGTYTVVVTDVSGCTNESQPYGITLGIADFEALAKLIKVFPNPARSFIQVEAPVKVNITLSTIDGKEMLHEKNAKKTDISHLAAGMYLLRITDQNNTPVKVEKVVKE